VVTLTFISKQDKPM